MSVTQSIPNTRVSGSHTFTLTNTAAVFTSAQVNIDRTVNGGLNALTTADTLTIAVDYSLDGGTTWLGIASCDLVGGVIITKGVTLASDLFEVGIGRPFPIGTGFRVRTTASTPVRVAGTVVYN